MTREDIYRELSLKYGWTPEQIADMTPHQQLVYLRPNNITTCDTLAEAQALLRRLQNG